MSEPLFYAKNGCVWKRPVETDNGDGSKNVSMGLSVCRILDGAGDGAAEEVADLMNRGDQFPSVKAALEQIEQQLDYGQHDSALRIAREALAALAPSPSPVSGREEKAA